MYSAVGEDMNDTESFPSLEALLHRLGLIGESAQVECKESLWQLPRDVWETVSAFSNTAGGTLLLGVAQHAGQFVVTGLLDAPKIQHDLATGLHDVMNVPIPAQVEPLILPVAGEERVILRVYIPEALPYQKPIYVRSAGLDKGCYKRVAGEDMPCTEDDLARFFQARSLISPDMTPVPTVAGVLMFGTPALIRRCFPAFRVDLVDIEGTEWVTAPTERGAGRSFQGPLLDVVRDVLTVLWKEVPERFALHPGEAQRMADPMHVALREAIHNALMHQDYRIHRPTQIRRFADRLEIENPGASLRDPDRLGEPGSELRNPRIAQMFYEIGWAEQKGTGIRAMQRAMDDLGLTPPTFESDPKDRSFRVTFYRHHFMDQSDLAWLEQFSALRLTTEEQKALVYARKTGRVDNAAFRSLNHTDTLTASRALTHLEGLGLLERSEQRRGPGVYYTLAEEAAETPRVTPKTNTFQISDVQTSEVSEVPLAGQVQAHLRPILPPSVWVGDLRGLT